MNPKDPIAVYNAESGQDARMAQMHLEAQGIEATAIEDNSATGFGWLGALPGISNSQVWVSRGDAERASVLIDEYTQRQNERRRAMNAKGAETLAIECEKCQKVTKFSELLVGTIQECRLCRSYVDVARPGDSDTDFFGDPPPDRDSD